MQFRLTALLVSAALLGISGCRRDDAQSQSPAASSPQPSAPVAEPGDWPRIDSAIEPDPAVKARVKQCWLA